MPGAMLTVLSPDGRELEMPEENLAEAEKHGYRLADSAGGAAGGAQPAPPRMVPVLSPDGRHLDVPAENLKAAIDAGYEPQTTLGEDVRTAAEGAASGLSIGVSDLAQTAGAGLGTAIGNALADDVGPGVVPHAAGPGLDAPVVQRGGQIYDEAAAADALQGMRTRETASPVISGVSKVGGALLPAILSGGATAPASGMQAAARLTPAGATSLLAARVQAALAPEGAGLLTRVMSLGAAGATEAGASSAVRRVVDDLAEGNHDLSAERMLHGLSGVLEDAGLGMLMGTAVGGAVEGSASAIRAGREMVAGVQARRAAAAAEPTLAFDLTQGPVAAAENAGPLISSQLPRVAESADSSLVQAARGAAQDFGETQQGATRAIAGDMDTLLRNVDAVEEGAGLAAKRALASQLTEMDPVALENAFRGTHGALEEIELSTKSMVDELGEAALQDRGGLATLKRIEVASKDTMRRMVHKLENGDIGDAYMAVDDFKRILGRAQNTPNPLIQARVRSMYDRVRLVAEDEGLWGELATKQKMVNPAITEKIRRSGDDLVRRFFRTSGESATDPFEKLTQSNGEAIGSLLNSLGSAESEQAEKALRLYMRSLAVDAETRAAAFGTPELAAQAQEVSGAVNRIENRMNAVALAKQDQKAWAKVMAYAPGSTGGILKGAAKAAQVAVSPIKKLAQSAVKQQQAVQTAAVQARHALMNAASPGAVRAAVTGAALLTAAHVTRAVSQARALQDDRSPESARLRQAVHELSQDDPFFAQALDAKARNKAAFIASKAGVEIDDGDPWGARPAMRDPMSSARLARYVSAAEDPGAALKRISHGQGSAEDIETLKTVHPLLYQTYVGLVQAEMQRAKGLPGILQRQHLYRATGVPMAREQRPDYLAWMQANIPPTPMQPAQGPQGQKPMGRGKIDPEKHYAARSDQVLEGGE